MKRTPVEERIGCWTMYCDSVHIKLDKILLHPNDRAEADKQYGEFYLNGTEILPIVYLGDRQP